MMAVNGKYLRALRFPAAYKKSKNGATVEVKIQPKVEKTNSTLLSLFASPIGLKKKKLGNVATTSQNTIKITAPKIPIM